VLQLEQLNAYYGKLQVLYDLSLSVRGGERVGVFGHNGAGKTTLLRCCVGEMSHVSGRVRYGEHDVMPGEVDRNARRGIGFVPQGHNVFRDLTVAQNLRIAGLLHDPGYRETIYSIFPVLRQRRDDRAGSLSGGQQQMLALGMALMSRPTMLLLDEPTTGLAPIVVRDVLASIRDINASEGTTIVIVEQNVQATIKEVERAIVLKSGRAIYDGPSAHLLEQESLWHLF
jgi:branched-chain amino acid transport system ATP-binding protein